MAKKTETRIMNLKELGETLKKRRNAHAEGFEKGMERAGDFLLFQAMAIVPVETGYLRSTGRTKKTGSGFKTIVKVIFTAAYSIWVHERLDLAHGKVYNIKYAEDIAAGRKKAKGPQEQAKFIETPLRKFKKQLLQMIIDEMNAAARKDKQAAKKRK